MTKLYESEVKHFTRAKKSRMLWNVIAITLSCVAMLASGVLCAQEYKAVITGVITDSSKAVIPGAVVTVHDLDTNQSSVVTTNGDGSYRTNPLTPSDNYQLTVTAKGFKTSILAPFALSVDQTATANVVMQPGAVAEEVNVSADALLDAQKADIGTVLDNKMISEMPIPSRSIFALAPLAAGVNNSVMGNTTQSYTPSTYESSTDFSVNGAGGNTTNVNVDGMSVLANVLGSNGVGITPIVDSVQEFKLVTSAYDASYGHSSATMDVALKAGTDTFHGAAWEYIRETFLDANTYLNNSQTPPTPQPSLSQNMFGGELDGPLYIPKLYSRAHKTFFMLSYERYHRNYPNFGYSDTVDPQWLTGDFSNLVNLNGQQIPIFDSSSANAANGYARTQFPNNQIPLSRLDPVALKILSYYPKANYFNVPGAQPYEQFFAHFAPATELTPHYTFRIDQQIGSKDHAFVEFQHQRTVYTESEGVPGIGATGDLPEVSDSYNYGGDWTHTVKSNLLLDVRANYQRYIFTDSATVNEGFDLTTLGLPAGLQAEVPGPKQFPVISLSSNYLGLGVGVYVNASNTYNFNPDVIWTAGRHTVRFGTNIILSQYSPFTNNGGLSITANSSPTQEYFNAGGSSTPSNNSGNSVASLLLGGVGASVYVTDTAFYSYRYFAPWIQDDWRLTPRLTLNLGFRWDFQTPPTERHNRANSGFDATVINPLSNQVPASFGPIHGGLTFAGVDGERRGPFNLDITNLQPRIGFAYTLYPNVVLRGGYGRYFTNSTIYSLPANFGYSYTANSVNSLNGGRNYLSSALDNPFPNGVSPAPGNAQGLTTNAGQGIYYYDNNYKLPHSDSFSVGLEQTAGRKGVFSLNYVASRSVSQGSLDEDENLAMYASCDYTKGGNQSICQNLVNNPFYGLSDVNTSVSSQPQVSAYSLSVPYPQYTSVTNYGTFQPGARPYSWYNSMQLSYHAHTRDLDINASETWAKLIDTGGYTDSVYRLRARHVDSSDSAHHVIVNSVLQIPIGRGERVWGNMNRLTDLAIGGWRLGSIYTFVTGAPQSTGGLIPIGPVRTKGLQQTGSKMITSDLNPCVESWQFSNSITGAGSWVLTPGSQLRGCTTASWQVQTGYQPDTSQGITDQVRQPDYYDFDTNLSKTFSLVGRLKFQLRLEAYNVLNHPTYNENYSTNYSNGEFGTINKENTKQANLPRQMQIAGRLTW